MTVGGLPLQFSTDANTETFKRGLCGRGPKTLNELDLHSKTDLNDSILRQAVSTFQSLKIPIRDIFYFGGFWQITTIHAVDAKQLPYRIANSPAFYRTVAEAPDGDPAALRKKVPEGKNADDTQYVTASDAILRPGIMVSSSLYTIIDPKDNKTYDVYDTTTSGILVADTDGQFFVTVATHGFQPDGHVYHPNPKTGILIGNIVDSIPHTDISIVKLKPGLRYVNETFGTPTEPEGTRINGITPPYPPHLRAYDALTMNSPFTGKCEGQVLAVGARIIDDDTGGKLAYIKHQWLLFENGDEPVEGCCGTPLTDGEGAAVGLFRFKHEKDQYCLVVSAQELREYGYEICGGLQQFT